MKHFMYLQLLIPHLLVLSYFYGVLKFVLPVHVHLFDQSFFFPLKNDYKTLLSFLEVLVSAPRNLFFYPFGLWTFYPKYSYAMNIFYSRSSSSFLWRVIEDECCPCEIASWFCQTQWPTVNST